MLTGDFGRTMPLFEFRSDYRLPSLCGVAAKPHGLGAKSKPGPPARALDY